MIDSSFPDNPLGLTRDQIIQSDMSRYAEILGSSPMRTAFEAVVAEMPWWPDERYVLEEPSLDEMIARELPKLFDHALQSQDAQVYADPLPPGMDGWLTSEQLSERTEESP